MFFKQNLAHPLCCAVWLLALVLAGCCCCFASGASSSSATDEIQQRNLPLMTDEQLLNTNKRFQQIMQGANQASGDASWPQAPKFKTDKVNVKAEIEKLNSSYVYQGAWPEAKVKLGSVTAVCFDGDGNVVIFHRVDRIWTQHTFNTDNVFIQRNLGPIRESTVLALERVKGQLLYEWGKGLFYMPHGLTVDHEDNVWLTDVALHQVFKFGPKGSNDKALLTLGTAFVPGKGDNKFCKPTSVAVLKNGDFFVADGYCNARIVKYSKQGQKILVWGQNSFSGISYSTAPINYFAVPHALTLVPEQELLCVADRENGRVQCFYWTNGTFHSQYHNQVIGDRLFSMAYTPAEGGQLVIVNGPTTLAQNEVLGFVMNMKTKQLLSKFAPNDMQFQNPHDVAVTSDGNEIYVAELDPQRIHKFLHKQVSKSMPISAAKPAITTGVGPEYQVANTNTTNGTERAVSSAMMANTESSVSGGEHKRPGSTAILVACLMLLFAFLTFALALLVARRRRRGNAQISVGQPSELVYRKLVASNQNLCDECP